MTKIFTTTTNLDGGKYVIGRKQQFSPERFIADEPISQLLVEAAHADDLQLASKLVSNPLVDVNFIGTVSLKSRKAEVTLNGESASEVRIEFEEYRTDVTTLFVAAHNGNITLVTKLLNGGANVNQKLFRGYATTAAVREGHIEVLELLLSSAASQAAYEEALLEACYLGRARAAELLIVSAMIRSHVAVHALVTASSRGFVDFVQTLIKSGVDANANARILLQSSKPSLHANVECNALVAAIVSRQASVVELLLKVGCRTDTKVRLGAWSWDLTTGEEFRVGAGLAEPYGVTWCAVEYFESSGVILRMLLHHISPNTPHLGRTILHHAIMCRNPRAFDVLLTCGADIETPVETTAEHAIHLAARFGLSDILRRSISAGCDLNSETKSGETAVMICARYKKEECLRLLASAGSDFGLSNTSNQSATWIAGSVGWAHGFQRTILDVIKAGKMVRSSNPEIFSSLLFAARADDVEALKRLVEQPDLNLDEQDENGFTAVMVAAEGGNVETFELLVDAGADLEIQNKNGENAITLADKNQNCDVFQKVLSEYAYTNCKKSSALHRAARLGDLVLVRELAIKGQNVNSFDLDGYTPLMLAARSGDGEMCRLLISHGAKCEVKNARNETALSLSRADDSCKNDAERVIFDELARKLVSSGAHVTKHTKSGKGTPHVKILRMVEASGVLSWGKSSKRNVVCRGADIGPSSTFKWNRRMKGDVSDSGVFRVVTTKNREVHFSCQGGLEMARLWVRGIMLVTRDAIFGKNFGDV